MMTALFAYFFWIVALIGLAALAFRLLQTNRPRPVRIPVRRRTERR